MQTRIILYHIHPVSGRILLLRFEHGGVCGVAPLPERAWFEEQPIQQRDEVAIHPAFTLTQALRHLQLPEGRVTLESGFHQRVESSEGAVMVFLGRLTSHDAPFSEIDRSAATLIEMQDVRALRRVEQLLLGRVYDFAMGAE